MLPEHVHLPLHPKKNANYIFMDDDEKEKFANTFNLRCIASYRMQE